MPSDWTRADSEGLVKDGAVELSVSLQYYEKGNAEPAPPGVFGICVYCTSTVTFRLVASPTNPFWT